MVNILDIDPGCFGINDTNQCIDGTIIYNICYNDKIGYHILFLIILIVILKKLMTFFVIILKIKIL